MQSGELIQHNYQPVKSINSEDGLPFVIKDGKYQGKWGGWQIDVKIEGRWYIISTLIGVRGFDIPVEVLIENGEVWFK